MDISTIPIWVNLRRVPIQMWNDDGLSELGSHIGEPQCMDTMTEERTRTEFARICVDITTDKILPNKIPLVIDEHKTIYVLVEYSYISLKCKHCRVFGHNDTNCRANKENSKGIETSGAATDNSKITSVWLKTGKQVNPNEGRQEVRRNQVDTNAGWQEVRKKNKSESVSGAKNSQGVERNNDKEIVVVVNNKFNGLQNSDDEDLDEDLLVIESSNHKVLAANMPQSRPIQEIFAPKFVAVSDQVSKLGSDAAVNPGTATSPNSLDQCVSNSGKLPTSKPIPTSVPNSKSANPSSGTDVNSDLNSDKVTIFSESNLEGVNFYSLKISDAAGIPLSVDLTQNQQANFMAENSTGVNADQQGVTFSSSAKLITPNFVPESSTKISNSREKASGNAEKIDENPRRSTRTKSSGAGKKN